MQVPESRRDRARELVADSLALSVAGLRVSPVARRAVAAAAAGADGGVCRVLGAGRSLPPPAAAFANAALAHVLDADDTHDRARLHTTTVVLPAALAAGELASADGAGIHGGTVLDAVVVGSEVMCRLGIAALASGGRAADWYLTQLVGVVGAAVAAGLVLDLDEVALASAVGHAVGHASGAKESARGGGGDARAVYPGHAAADGVLAALLAHAGVTGPLTGLEGDSGMWRTHLGASADRLADVLGSERDSEFDRVVVKPWPGCRASHSYIDAVLRLPDRVRADPGRIERVTVAVDTTGARLCTPIEDRRRPTTPSEAGFSIPYMTAAALAFNGVGLPVLSPDALRDPAVLRIADLVQVEHRIPDGPDYAAAEIEVVYRGTTHTATGASSPAPTRDGEIAKFRAVLAHAGCTAAVVNRLAAAVDVLDEGPAAFTRAVDAAVAFPQVHDSKD